MDSSKWSTRCRMPRRRISDFEAQVSTQFQVWRGGMLICPWQGFPWVKSTVKTHTSQYAHMLHGTGIFTYIYHTNQPNVGKHTIHGFYGMQIMMMTGKHFLSLIHLANSKVFFGFLFDIYAVLTSHMSFGSLIDFIWHFIWHIVW